jgi:hypothetical protein
MKPVACDPHVLIRQAMQGHWDDRDLVAALAACPDMECQECARIVCFSGDPMHFHHDGCPSCEAGPVDRGPLTVPAELTDDATWVAFDLARNVDKGPRLAQRDAAAAVEAQLVDFRAKGML